MKMKPSPPCYDKQQISNTEILKLQHSLLWLVIAAAIFLPSAHLKEREAFQAFTSSGSSLPEAVLEDFKDEEIAISPPQGGVKQVRGKRPFSTQK